MVLLAALLAVSETDSIVNEKTGSVVNAGQLRKTASNAKPVARELAPARLRSSRKVGERGVPDTTRLQVLGPLRAPAGASPLATNARQTRFTLTDRH